MYSYCQSKSRIIRLCKFRFFLGGGGRAHLSAPGREETWKKGPKFAPAPSKIPYKEIVTNIEAGIENLADDTKELVRNATVSILNKAQPPAKTSANMKKEPYLN